MLQVSTTLKDLQAKLASGPSATPTLVEVRRFHDLSTIVQTGKGTDYRSCADQAVLPEPVSIVVREAGACLLQTWSLQTLQRHKRNQD